MKRSKLPVMGLGLAMAVVTLADASAVPDDTVFVNADNYMPVGTVPACKTRVKTV